MRKRLSVLVGALVLLGLVGVFAACGADEEPTPVPLDTAAIDAAVAKAVAAAAPTAGAPEAAAPEAMAKPNYEGKVELVAYSFGGKYDEGSRALWCEEIGLKCTFHAGGSVSNVSKVIAEKNNPQADLLFVDDALVPELIENGAIIPIDIDRCCEENYDGYFGFVKEEMAALENHFIPILLQITGITYRKDLLDENGLSYPTGWDSLWDPQYKGKVQLETWTKNSGWSTVEAIAAVRCGDPKNLDCAYEEVKKLKDTGQLWGVATSGSQRRRNLTDGTSWVAITSSRTAAELKAGGVDVGFIAPPEYPVSNTTGFVVTSDRNYEAVMDFLKQASTPQLVAKWLDYSSEGPVHSRVRDYASTEMIARNPTTEVEAAGYKIPDFAFMRSFRPSFMDPI